MHILVPTSRRFLERTKVMKDEYNIDFSVIMVESLMRTPPWHIFNYIHVCEQLYTERKSQLDPTAFRGVFEDHFRLHINDTFVLTDISRTNSGVAYVCICGTNRECLQMYSTIPFYIHCRITGDSGWLAVLPQPGKWQCNNCIRFSQLYTVHYQEHSFKCNSTRITTNDH